MKLSKIIALSSLVYLLQSSALAAPFDKQIQQGEAACAAKPSVAMNARRGKGSEAKAAVNNSTWKIDPLHTKAGFTVKHMMVSNVRGEFAKVSGTAHYDGQSLANSDVSAVIDASSVNTNEPQRDQHLKSPDFFDAAKYPTISFKSKKVETGADGFKIIGDLTMHGITKTVTLTAEPLPPPIKDPMGFLRTGTEARAKINRKDFGVAFDKVMDNGGALVGDDVDITIDVELIQKPATAESKSTL